MRTECFYSVGPCVRVRWTHLMLLGLLAFAWLAAVEARGDTATGQSLVATVHPLATEAGVEALRKGGNAVDAAVAAALTLGVVDGHNSGIGGGCFILIRLAGGRTVAIDGRETAPAQAHRDMFLRDGKAVPELSQTGPLASGVPGALAAYARATQRYGRRELAELLEPAAQVAEQGFPLDANYARNLASTADALRQFDGSRQMLLKEDGSPYREGEVLRLPDLAKTYRAVAEHGLPYFYGGPLARRVERWMAEHGGLLTAEDFAAYEAIERQPVVSSYRDYTIVGFPPPSSGGVHVAQILNILEHFDLAELRKRSEADFVHTVAEAMKLAFADRAYWLGDPDFARVPRGLIGKPYATKLARRIDVRRAGDVAGHGTPPNWQSEVFGKHTTHISAADDEGNWVAITATVNTSFGSKVVVPGTGVILNNEMDDFSIQPGVPNAFGLIGAEANAVAPGKRPLSSMSPTVVLEDGRPRMTVGAAGGPKIITQVVLAIVNHLDLQMPIDQAVAAPRFHHQWSPDRLDYEAGLGEDVVGELRRRGHQLQQIGHTGVTQAIAAPEPGESPLIGVADPRVQGKAKSLQSTKQ